MRRLQRPMRGPGTPFRQVRAWNRGCLSHPGHLQSQLPHRPLLLPSFQMPSYLPTSLCTNLSKLPLQVYNKFCFYHTVLLGPLTSFFPSLGALTPPHGMAFVYSFSQCWIYDYVGRVYIYKAFIPSHPPASAHSKHLINTNYTYFD